MLTFINSDPANDNSNALDNITLIDLGHGPAVPEPPGLPLLATGLLGLGCLRRHRASRCRARKAHTDR
jgi:hypothetical protein